MSPVTVNASGGAVLPMPTLPANMAFWDESMVRAVTVSVLKMKELLLWSNVSIPLLLLEASPKKILPSSPSAVIMLMPPPSAFVVSITKLSA